jgi:hypothetical protein
MDIEVRTFTPMKPESYRDRKAITAKAERKANLFNEGYTLNRYILEHFLLHIEWSHGIPFERGR